MFDNYLIQVSMLNHRAQKMFANIRTLQSDLKDSPSSGGPGTSLLADAKMLLQDARDTDSLLSSWLTTTSLEWHYSMIERSECVTQTSHVPFTELEFKLDDMFYGTSAHAYASIGHAAIWNRYRVLRLIVNSIIIQALDHCSGHSKSGADTNCMQTRKRQTVGTIQALVDDICASVPYHFGFIASTKPNATLTHGEHGSSLQPGLQIKANTIRFLIWSLTTAKSLSIIPKQQRDYIKDRLLDVSCVCDDGIIAAIAKDELE